MEAFVYRWRHKTTKMWYIGYHKGTANDGYICSSQTARPLIEQDKDCWQRKILRSGNKAEMIALEHKLLKRLNARQNPKSLNKSNGGVGAPLSLSDQLGYDLNSMSSEEIAKHYVKELANGDLHRIFLVDKWIFNKVML